MQNLAKPPLFHRKISDIQIKERPICLIDIGQNSAPKHEIKVNPGQSRRGGLPIPYTSFEKTELVQP